MGKSGCFYSRKTRTQQYIMNAVLICIVIKIKRKLIIKKAFKCLEGNTCVIISSGLLSTTILLGILNIAFEFYSENLLITNNLRN